MSGLLYVALGGALGASSRYGLGLWIDRAAGASFPYGTLSANILGSFLMGILAAWLAMKSGGSDGARLFIGVGLLGGFTTFSSFSLDAMNLLRDKGVSSFVLYVGASVAMSLLAITAGLWVARKILS
jgi:CrcB protein